MTERESLLATLLPRSRRRRRGLTVLDRTAPVLGGQRAVQQAILRGFAATGTAPTSEQLAEAIGPYGGAPESVVAQLAAEDYLALDGDGRIRAAYPFSAVPTPHRVQLGGGVQVYAMCAIDTLGMAKMLGSDLRIESTDPHTSDPITVIFTTERQRGLRPARWSTTASWPGTSPRSTCAAPT